MMKRSFACRISLKSVVADGHIDIRWIFVLQFVTGHTKMGCFFPVPVITMIDDGILTMSIVHLTSLWTNLV